MAELKALLFEVRGGDYPPAELELCPTCSRRTIWASATQLVCPVCLLASFEKMRQTAIDLLAPFAANPDSSPEQVKEYRTVVKADPPVWETK